MGRVDQTLTAEPGTKFYVVHLCFYTVVHLFVRIMKCKNKSERDWQLVAIMEVLRFLVTHKDCYHSFVEAYFEEDTSQKRPGCGQYCSHYNGNVKDLTGLFYMRRMMSVLSTNIFRQGKDPPKVKEFVKAIKAKKDYIWK